MSLQTPLHTETSSPQPTTPLDLDLHQEFQEIQLLDQVASSQVWQISTLTKSFLHNPDTSPRIKQLILDAYFEIHQEAGLFSKPSEKPSPFVFQRVLRKVLITLLSKQISPVLYRQYVASQEHFRAPVLQTVD